MFHFFPVDDNWAQYMRTRLHLTPCRIFHASNRAVFVPRTCDIHAYPVDLHRVLGDGNCFFRCLSFLLTQSEDYHQTMRLLTINAIRQSFLPSSQSVRDYIAHTRMSIPNTWSTEVEILAAATLLQTDIYTYALHGDQWTWLRFPNGGNLRSRVDLSHRAIYLVNTNSNHYDVVLDVCKTPLEIASAKPVTTLKSRDQSNCNKMSKWNILPKPLHNNMLFTMCTTKEHRITGRFIQQMQRELKTFKWGRNELLNYLPANWNHRNL